MPKKIIACTTDGQAREDANVYYAKYLLVESDTLKFDEPLFELIDNDGFKSVDDIKAALESIGYSVTAPDVIFTITEFEDDEDDEG